MDFFFTITLGILFLVLGVHIYGLRGKIGLQ